MDSKKNKIIIYSTRDGKMKLEVRLEKETIWLSQKQMAELLDCSTDNISLHLKNVYFEGELVENQTTEDFSVVQKEGNKEVRRSIKLYNLDAIISVGYRVNSLRGTQFRIWATQKLKEYIVKGFVMDDERLASGEVTQTYFKELEERLMYMKDWINELSEFLIFNKKKILNNSGIVSRNDMEEKVRLELAKYNSFLHGRDSQEK